MTPRRHLQGLRRKPLGSAVIYALVVMVAGTFVLAGWAHLMATRTLYTEQLPDGITRRLTLENSRLMATEYVLQYMSGAAISTNAVVSTDFGGFSVSVAPDFWSTFGQPASNSPFVSSFSVAGATRYIDASTTNFVRGYMAKQQASLSDGTTNSSWTFQMRTRSPVWGWDLVTLEAGATVGGGLALAPNAALGTPVGPAVDGALLGVAVRREISGIDAFFAEALTAGTDIDPFVEVEDDVDKTKLYTCDGAGHVTIYLKRPPSSFDPDLIKTYRLTGTPLSLTFSDDALDPSVDVSLWPPIRVVSASMTLASINVANGNQRRLYLGIDNGGTPLAISFAGDAASRLAAVFRNAPVTLSVPGNLQLTGGIQTDSSLTTGSGTVTFFRELNPRTGLERSAARRAWLEVYRE